MLTPVAALAVLGASLLIALFGLHWIALDRREKDVWAEKVLDAERVPAWLAVLRRAEARLDRVGVAQSVGGRMTAAGLPLSPARALAVSLAGTVAVFVAATALLPSWAAVLAAVAVFRAAGGVLERLRKRRHARLLAQLPDVARAVAAASATRSLLAAIERTSERVAEPAASELRRLVGRTRLGWSLPDALEEMRRDMPDPEVGLLVATLIVHDASGGDAVKALRGIADAMEARQRLKREVRTHLSGVFATVRLVALIGIAMPFGIDAISDGAVENLTGSPFGRVVTTGAIALYVVGLFLITRIGRTRL